MNFRRELRMPLGICLIAAGLPQPSAVTALLGQCGMAVWTPSSPDADDGHMYERAVCLVIDMPARTGFDTLRLLRGYGVNTPALLVVDGGPASRFDESAWALNVVPRTADPRDVMHWIESMCITRQLLEPVRQDEGRANRLSIA